MVQVVPVLVPGPTDPIHVAESGIVVYRWAWGRRLDSPWPRTDDVDWRITGVWLDDVAPPLSTSFMLA